MIETVTGFHIEPTNICTLKCSGCARTKFLDQWPQHWRNHNLDIDVLLKFLDIDLTGKKIHLCGNYGDPIYHTDFIGFVTKLKQAKAVLSITTNGSYRTQDWWNQLVSVLDDQDVVKFSIDGVPENFTQYRKNADWDSIKIAIETCVSGRCQTAWKYIPFDYNEGNIEQAEQLAKTMGIDRFFLDPSDRFDDGSSTLRPSSQNFIGARHSARQNWKTQKHTPKIDPLCESGREHFITADGYYSSCCFSADHRFYYKNEFGKNKKSYSISETSLSEILARPPVVEFYKKLDTHDVCQFCCPKKDLIV